MKNIKINNIQKMLKKVETSKAIIAKERDKLRDYKDDLEGLLESLNNGEEAIDCGLSYLESGLDEISKHL